MLIAIDPGVHGAVAWECGDLVDVANMPSGRDADQRGRPGDTDVGTDTRLLSTNDQHVRDVT